MEARIHHREDYLEALPERLTVTAFRSWMLACQTSDLNCINRMSDDFESALGGRAGAYCGALAGRWVKLLWRATPEPIGVYPPCCRYLSRDECLCAAIVAAAQHGEDDIALAASCALLRRGSESNLHGHLALAADFASALAECGQRLMHVPGHVVNIIAAPETGTRH